MRVESKCVQSTFSVLYDLSKDFDMVCGTIIWDYRLPKEVLDPNYNNVKILLDQINM